MLFDTHSDEDSTGVGGCSWEEDEHPVQQPGVGEDEEASYEAEDATAHHHLLHLLVILDGDLSPEGKRAEDGAGEEEGDDGEEGVDEEPGGELLVALPLNEGDDEADDAKENRSSDMETGEQESRILHLASSTVKMQLIHWQLWFCVFV